MSRISSDQRMNDLEDSLSAFQGSLSTYMNARRAYDDCLKSMQTRLISRATAYERLPALLEARYARAKEVRRDWITLKKDMRVANENKSF